MHNIFHLQRVWTTAQKLGIDAPVNWLVVPIAYYLYGLVSLPKNHPERHRSSILATLETRRVLIRDFPDFPRQRLSVAYHTTEAHSFSARIAPETPEAKIVQDADRLEALGTIGLARVFVVSGAPGISLFSAEGPLTRKRSLDDKQYVLDHFQTKLLTLLLTMQTEQGRRLVQRNADPLLMCMTKLSAESKREYEVLDLGVIQSFRAY